MSLMNKVVTAVGHARVSGGQQQSIGTLVEEATAKADAQFARKFSTLPTASVIKNICTQLHVGNDFVIYTITAWYDER